MSQEDHEFAIAGKPTEAVKYLLGLDNYCAKEKATLLVKYGGGDPVFKSLLLSKLYDFSEKSIEIFGELYNCDYVSSSSLRTYHKKLDSEGKQRLRAVTIATLEKKGLSSQFDDVEKVPVEDPPTLNEKGFSVKLDEAENVLVEGSLTRYQTVKVKSKCPHLRLVRTGTHFVVQNGSSARIRQGFWKADSANPEEEENVVVKCYDYEDKKTFLHEVGILQHLQHKKYIVKLLDYFGSDGDSFENYIVMEKLVTLKDYMKLNPVKTIEQKWLIVKNLVAAVHWMHKRKTVHGDLHPANVCLDQDDCVKLIDFERGKSYVNSAHSTLFPWGKHPGWYPPEVKERSNSEKGKGCLTKREDMWMLGRLLACIFAMNMDGSPFVEEDGDTAKFVANSYLLDEIRCFRDRIVEMVTSQEKQQAERAAIEFGKKFVILDAVCCLMDESPEMRPTARELLKYFPFKCGFERLLGRIQLSQLAAKFDLELPRSLHDRYRLFAGLRAPDHSDDNIWVLWTFVVESVYPNVWQHIGKHRHFTKKKPAGKHSSYDSIEDPLEKATRFLRNLCAHCVEYESKKDFGKVQDVENCLNMLLPLCCDAYAKARLVVRRLDLDSCAD